MILNNLKLPGRFGDRIYIDGDNSITGYVTAFLWRDQDGVTVEVSWMHNYIERLDID